MRGSTYTFAVLDLSHAAYDEISRKLKAAGYGHAFCKSDGHVVIDMQGIAVARDGGVSADLSILLRTVPTSTELANAKASAIARGVPRDIVERAAELIGFGDPK